LHHSESNALTSELYSSPGPRESRCGSCGLKLHHPFQVNSSPSILNVLPFLMCSVYSTDTVTCCLSSPCSSPQAISVLVEVYQLSAHEPPGLPTLPVGTQSQRTPPIARAISTLTTSTPPLNNVPSIAFGSFCSSSASSYILYIRVC
jgi:hypothetical protein